MLSERYTEYLRKLYPCDNTSTTETDRPALAQVTSISCALVTNYSTGWKVLGAATVVQLAQASKPRKVCCNSLAMLYRRVNQVREHHEQHATLDLTTHNHLLWNMTPVSILSLSHACRAEPMRMCGPASSLAWTSRIQTAATSPLAYGPSCSSALSTVKTMFP